MHLKLRRNLFSVQCFYAFKLCIVWCLYCRLHWAFNILLFQLRGRHWNLQVIRDRRWNEVARALNFPVSIINPSFVLRKHYIDLLYHFEKIYCFKGHGQLPYPPGMEICLPQCHWHLARYHFEEFVFDKVRCMCRAITCSFSNCQILG